MRCAPAAVAAAMLFSCGASWAADKQELTISAKVDKTTVDIGTPMTFTLTLSGDLSGAQVPTPKFPDGFQVAAQTQATNISMQGGVVERSTSLVFVLMPTREGTYQLGPFTVTQQDQNVETVPIEVTVKKAPLPPTLKPDSHGRFTI